MIFYHYKSFDKFWDNKKSKKDIYVYIYGLEKKILFDFNHDYNISTRINNILNLIIKNNKIKNTFCNVI